MKRDLIKEIVDLNLSETEKIIDILTYDFKNEFNMNLNNVFVKTNNISNVEKFLKYRIISSIKYKYTFALIDCDTTELTKNILEKIYDKVSADKYNRIYTLNNEIRFESDTMNSFQTIFGAYMRYFIPKEHVKNKQWAELYVEDYDANPTKDYNHYKEAELYRNFWILENFNDIKSKAQAGKEKEIFDELEIFAGLTHTIGNFALVPYQYNTYRGCDKDLSDYWDLSYNKLMKCENTSILAEDITKSSKLKVDKTELREQIEKSINEYKKIKKSYDELNLIYDKQYPTSRVKFAKEDIYLKILKEINSFIIKRGIQIILEISGKNSEEIQINNDELVEAVKKYLINKK